MSESAAADAAVPAAAAPATARPERVPLAEAVQPVANEKADRIITGLLTVVPILLLGVAGWQVWNEALHWRDIAIFAVFYVATGLGVTVGLHRLFTHRAFKTGPRTRAVWAVLGSMAIEGPIISWVADHRKHHACSDKEGDPHSPHHGHGEGWKGQVKGLYHAHVGWLFDHTQRGSKERFASDLLRDPIVSYVDRTFFLWAILSLTLPMLIGWVWGGTIDAALTALLWGGIVRMFLLHHVTYSVNSLCHTFGRRPYDTKDESRNFAPVALLAFGEGWHNNHHAFPTSARHGLRWWQPDPTAAVITAMEKAGLAWDVVRIPPEHQAKKVRVA
ncbi:MAG: acyl-CoA desaturase [Solirubrobacterales bacterium]